MQTIKTILVIVLIVSMLVGLVCGVPALAVGFPCTRPSRFVA